MIRAGRLLAAAFLLLLAVFASMSMVSAQESATPVSPDAPGDSLSSFGDDSDLGTLGVGDIYGFITIVTADSAPLPSDTTIVVHNNTTGSDVYGNGTVSTSAQPLNIPPASTGDSITVTITATGYSFPGDTFVLGSIDYTPTYTLVPVGMVYSTLTITTSDLGNIPAGSLIQVTNGSPAGTLVYGEGVDPAAASGKTVAVPPVSTGSNLYVTITGATGYADLSAGPFTIDELNTTFSVTLQAVVTPTLTITTSDGGDIPANTIVAVYADTILVQGISISPAAPSGHQIILNPISSGASVVVQVYNATGYESVNSAPVIVTGGSASIDVTIRRIFTPSITISTSDGQNIPENTIVAIFRDGDTSTPWFTNGVDLDGAPSVTLSLPDVPDGTVLTAQVYNAAGYDAINATPVTITTGTTSIDVTIQRTAVASQVTVDTEDGNLVPAGTHIVVTNSSDGDAVVFDQTLAAPSGVPLPLGMAPVVPGSELAVSITGATGYVDLVAGPFTVNTAGDNFDVELSVLPVTAAVATANGLDIPAGTTWELHDALDDPLQSGSIDGASGTALGLTNPIFNGNYILYVTDPTGTYLPFVQGFEVTATDKDFSFTLIPVPVVVGDVNLTITTSDGGNIPAGAIITIGGITYTATGSETSGSIIPFTGVPEGEQFISVTNSLPYLFSGGTVDVVAGSSTDASILLIDYTEPVTTGSVALTVTTSDGGMIPAGTTFTLGGVTFTATGSDFSTADLASGTVIPFTDVPEGEQVLNVTNAAPYQDFSGTVTVVAGETVDASIILVLTPVVDPPTPTPTQPSEPATPAPTATTAPVNPQNPVLPGKTPVPSTVTPGDGTTGPADGGSGVTTLPSTGQHPAGTSDAPWLLLGLVTMLAIVTLGFARRMQQR